MIKINIKISKLLISGILLIGFLTGAYLGVTESNSTAKAETIIIDQLNSNFPSNKNYNREANPFNEVLGWTNDDRLLFFTNVTKLPQPDNINCTISLEERNVSGDLYKTHKIQIPLKNYNKVLISDYYPFSDDSIENEEYILKLSPDKKKVLISTEVLNSKPLDNDEYRITNQGYSAIYDLETEKVTIINDSSRFIRWSSDSTHVFGINYAVCYHKFMESPYDQHFFPAHTYRNISYNILKNKITVVTNDTPLLESLKISKDTYENILNNANLDEKKRILLGYTSTNTVTESNFIIEKNSFTHNPYNLNYIIDITPDKKYLFSGIDNLNKNIHGMPAVYIGDASDNDKEKILETFIINSSDYTIDNEYIFFFGDSVESFKSPSNHVFGLNTHNIISGKDVLLYEGKVGSFAHSSKNQNIAIYDDVKKKILIGTLNDNKIIGLKSYYDLNLRAFDMYFNADGTKLYFEGSYKDISGVINLQNGEVMEVK